ncbi:hypothetical protein [Pollutimonas harenae]|uniref:Uncharacterized protein n=1 Tax=Pollutimonas harenae TaxID=657015 RepID=A0A853H381_9BURK|nr:hypothetical protein [Pollutimonas harenae]NYT85675.1 hypothetical protein [Pollutimonas harenae]TEA70750.1 hypothetical protein ERD84_08755 [Pollutimonas harenae]
MSLEMLVILKPEALTQRLLAAAATELGQEILKLYPDGSDQPAILQVKCKRVEATDYGLIRLGLGGDDQTLGVSVRPELVIATLDSEDRLPFGFLPEAD